MLRPRRMRHRVLLGLIGIAALAPVLAACGGSSSSSTTTAATATTGGATTASGTATDASGATVLNVQASPSELAFVPNTLSAPAGKIALRLTNPSQLDHSIALAVSGVAPGPVVGYGGVSEVVANLAPGTYVYYCTVPGHRQAGMTGTLTVH
jgi:uncharacterized cupredoxin-like copper-binding protein